MLLLKPDEIDFSEWAYSDEANRIYAPSQLSDDISEMLFGVPQDKALGLSLPWNSIRGAFGVRDGEVTLWHGANGHGKSLVIGQAILSLLNQGAKCAILSMEIEPRVTLYRMERQAMGASLPVTREAHARFISWADDKLWIYSRTGMVELDTVLSVMNYCNKKLGITQFVIDSLMKLGLGVEDFTAQKTAVARLCDFAMSRKVHIHLVVHSRKPADGEEKKPSKYDIKGAGDISDQADNVLNVWRHRKKERVMSGEIEGNKQDYMRSADAQIICDKQRHFSWEGAVKLWFHRPSLQFVEDSYGRPMELINISTDSMERAA